MKFFSDILAQFKDKKGLFIVYFVLRLTVIAVMIAQILNQNWNDVFMCALTLVLFSVPSFMEKRVKIDVPDTLEIIVLLFIFAAEILGEIREYYIMFPVWDTALHTINGFLCAAIGFSLIDILNRSNRCSISLSPIFTVMVAICFSMTIGVLWEFFEFGMDILFRTDMQKDYIVTSISSVLLNPDNRNIPVVLDIKEVVVNGDAWNYKGYIDIGLFDTMMDLFVNFAGAIIFCVFGMFYMKAEARHKGKRFLERFLLRRIK